VLSRTKLTHFIRNPKPLNNLQPLGALFVARVLCFQQFAASFSKTPGWGVPPQIALVESTTYQFFSFTSALPLRSLRLSVIFMPSVLLALCFHNLTNLISRPPAIPRLFANPLPAIPRSGRARRTSNSLAFKTAAPRTPRTQTSVFLLFALRFSVFAFFVYFTTGRFLIGFSGESDQILSRFN
jgi:hypothetical protein